MSITEYYLLSRAREILVEVQDVFASSQQEGSVMHQKAFRSALVNHLDAAERQQVPFAQLTSFLKTLRGTEGVGDFISEVTLGLISKSMAEGLQHKSSHNSGALPIQLIFCFFLIILSFN